MFVFVQDFHYTAIVAVAPEGILSALFHVIEQARKYE
jgi:hypothetical protein